MASRLYSVVVDSADVSALGRWWAEVLGWRVTFEEPDEVVVEVPDGEQLPGLVFVPVPEAKSMKNRIHLDLATIPRSTSPPSSPASEGWAPALPTSVRVRRRGRSWPIPRGTSSASSI